MPGFTDHRDTQPGLMDEAAAWLAALDAGSADRDAFEAWRGGDARRAVAFAQVAATWQDLDTLRLVAAGPAPPPPPATRRAGHPSRRGIVQAAASIVFVSAIGGGVVYRSLARETAATAIGQRRIVHASETLSVELNTDSRVAWQGGDPFRLWLERGEIAVQLAKGAAIELLAEGNQLMLRPGAYNARLRGAACELAVLSGAVATVGAPIGVGDVALVTAGQISARSHGKADAAGISAWQHDTLVLNGESLDYAVNEVNRYLIDKIVIGDPALSRLRIGGTFTTTDPGEFLRALHTTFGIRATGSASGVVLTRG